MLEAFIISLILSAISYALSPKPEGPQEPTAGEIEAPVNADGKEISVVFGSVRIDDPNVVDWGDTRAVAIKKKGGKK